MKRITLPPEWKRILSGLLISCWLHSYSSAQTSPPELDRVGNFSGQKYGTKEISPDQGASGAWQQLQKLQTTASVLYVIAHPDDEQADVLTYLSRGKGVRTALLSLNRGESGANVLGGELFDELGLLRTEELLLAGTHYGLDDLYFTDVVDYGFSKRVAESYEKWNKEHVLAEMVRVIRLNRPLIVVSRFHGSKRDGHGHHQAAGELTPEAFRLAGDPNAFPEQLTKEGLRPWQPLKLYRGGVKPEEPWNIALETGAYAAWLGETYRNVGALGYSFHRSQFGGWRPEIRGSSKQYFERLQTRVQSGNQESAFTNGIDTSIRGIFSLTGETAPQKVATLLQSVDADITSAIEVFRINKPADVIKILTNSLSNIRQAIRLTEKQPDARFMLRIKERQCVDVIHTLSGITVDALAVPNSTETKRNFYQPPPTMAAAVPGQSFKVEASFVNPGLLPVQLRAFSLLTPEGWLVTSADWGAQTLQPNEKTEGIFSVTVPEKAAFTQPYFSRASLQENHYTIRDAGSHHLPVASPVLVAKATYEIDGKSIDHYTPVLVQEANLPYDYEKHLLKVVPALAVNVQPTVGVVPVNANNQTLAVQVELLSNADHTMQGELRLNLPAGWQAQPAQIPFSFAASGERNNFSFTVSVPQTAKQTYLITAVATANGKEYTTGYTLIAHRDLDKNYLYRPATREVKGIDAQVAPGLQIGYVMGAGDQVPEALRQLGARVQLLGTADLANGKLNQYDAVLIGTRAYAVRQDLHTYNQRLLNYAQEGGNLIVLYQTPEFKPERQAPYPAKLPPDAEEVSEEDAPVELLAGKHPMLNQPNQITGQDFDGWVEQRGSKFFSEWDARYTPLLASQDNGQPVQRGGWLTAGYGKGNYTYCAYALHRQLPSGVSGAYRILANLISVGKANGK